MKTMVCSVALAAMALAQSAQAQSADLVAAAQQEGEINFYSSAPDVINNALVTAFKEAYPGIEVNWTRMVSNALFARFVGEQQSGVNAVDLIYSGSQAIYLEQPELFQDIGAIEGYSGVSPKAGNTSYVITSALPHIVTYNTDLVSEDEIKQHFATWEGAGDPFWKDRIATPDPLSSSNYMSFFLSLQGTYGDGLLQAMGDNEPAWFEGGVPAAQQLAAGAYAVAFPTVEPHGGPLMKKGAPLAQYLPEGPVHGVVSAAGIAKSAQHPKAAELFLTWIISPQGGQALACKFFTVPIVDLPGGGDCSLPDGFVAATDIITDEQSQGVAALLKR